MRAASFLFLLLLCSCTGPRASSIRYSPPNVAPVREKLDTVKSHADAAKHAIVENNLKLATQEIDSLLDELVNTQSALRAYTDKVEEQTKAANRALDEKNAAITERDKQAAKVRSIAKREHYFFLLLSAAMIWIFRTPLLGLLKMGASLITKIPI